MNVLAEKTMAYEPRSSRVVSSSRVCPRKPVKAANKEQSVIISMQKQKLASPRNYCNRRDNSRIREKNTRSRLENSFCIRENVPGIETRVFFRKINLFFFKQIRIARCEI